MPNCRGLDLRKSNELNGGKNNSLDSNTIEEVQTELSLNDRRRPIQLPDKEDPESTLVQETLSKVLKPRLSDAEFSRIERSIKRLDWNLDLIERDRNIKESIRRRLDKGMKLYMAVREVAERYYLSEEHVYTIYHGKKDRTASRD